MGALAVAAIAAAALAQKATLFQFTEKPGPHLVGFKVVEQYDYSRTYRSRTNDLGAPYPGERARPLQTLIWYPAEKSTLKPMTVGDYGNLAATETSFGKPTLSVDHKHWLDGIKPTLAMPMWAVRDAPPVSGRFPIVIYAPSFSSMSWENADLCEYLASHGYVVIAGPSMGASTRDMTNDLTGINAQARDISFLISYAESLPNTVMFAVAVAGFSWGGISNLFAAARDNRIDFLSCPRRQHALLPRTGEARRRSPRAMTIPLLFFPQGGATLEDQDRYAKSELNQGPSVLNAWTHGDLVLVRMLGLVHFEHSSMSQRNEDVWKRNFFEQAIADYDRADGIAGYAWIARYTVHFLDAYLKHDAAAMAWIKKTPADKGAPNHFLSASYRPAKGLPATLESFRIELGRQGFNHAEDVYAAMQKESPSFKLDESAVTAWGFELLTDNHSPEAIDILKLNAKNYPDSGNVYDSLGEAYVQSGQKQLASTVTRSR